MPVKNTISVGNGARDYPNIGAAFGGTECANRVANDEYIIIEVYNDDGLSIIGGNTQLVAGTSINTVTLQPAYGHDYSATDFGSTALKYDPTLGAALETVSGFGILLSLANDAYLTVNNMQLKCADSNGRMVYTGDGNTVFNNCLIVDNGQGDGAAPQFNNCLIIRDANLTKPGLHLNFAFANQCTVVVPSDLTHTGDLIGLGGTSTVNECAAFGGGTAYSNVAQADSDYNAADDATGPGANALNSLVFADQFENTNSTTQDWRRKTGNDLDGAGLGGIDVGFTIPSAIPAPLPSITNIDTDNIITSDQTSVEINGTVLAGVTVVSLVSGSVESIQSIQGSPTSTQVLFNAVQGELPYGPVVAEVDDGASVGTANITLITPAANQYVGVVNPGTDITTVFYNATTTPQTGDQLEWVSLSGNGYAATVQPNGTFSIAGGVGADTIQIRWREEALEAWGDWITITAATGVSANPVAGGTTPFNAMAIIPVSTVLASASPINGGAMSIDSVSPGANCESAAINGSNVDITPSANVSGALVVNYTVSEAGETETASSVINVTVSDAVLSQPYVWVFATSATPELTVTRGSNGLDDTAQQEVAVS